MNGHDLIVGAQVFHKIHRKNGVVESRPRAHSALIRLKLEGNASAAYYAIADIEFHGAPVTAKPKEETPAEPALPPPSSPPPPAKDTPVEHFNGTPGRATRAPEPAARNEYAGELTLDHLRGMRRKIRDGLELLDEKIARIVALDAVREAMQTVRFTGESGHRAALSVDALKIKQDTDQAIATANRIEANRSPL